MICVPEKKRRNLWIKPHFNALIDAFVVRHGNMQPADVANAALKVFFEQELDRQLELVEQAQSELRIKRDHQRVTSQAGISADMDSVVDDVQPRPGDDAQDAIRKPRKKRGA